MRKRWCLLVLLFAFLLGARIANADVVAYLENRFAYGASTGYGDVEEGQLALGAMRYAPCFAVRGGIVLTGALSTEPQRKGAFGIGGELEIDGRVAAWGSMGGRLEITPAGSAGFEQVLLGARFRAGWLVLGVDTGRYTAREERSASNVILFSAGFSTRRIGWGLLGTTALVGLGLLAHPPRLMY